jgi:hypothetical protein
MNLHKNCKTKIPKRKPTFHYFKLRHHSPKYISKLILRNYHDWVVLLQKKKTNTLGEINYPIYIFKMRLETPFYEEAYLSTP